MYNKQAAINEWALTFRTLYTFVYTLRPRT